MRVAPSLTVVHAGLDGSDARTLNPDEARPAAGGRRGSGKPRAGALWLVRSEDVLLLRRDLPVRHRRDLEQALPYALEEDLAGDPADYGFAFTRQGDGTHVVAVDRERLLAGAAALKARGLRPRVAVPDVLALPREEGAWTLLVAGARAMVRTGEFQGFACSVANLPFVLAKSLAEAPTAPTRLVAHGDMEALPGLPLAVEGEPGDPDAALVAGAAAVSRRLNLAHLLAGDGGLGAGDRRRLGVAAVLVLTAVAGLVGMRWYEVERLRADNARLATAIEDLYRQTFPEHRRVVDARLQMAQQLTALGGQDDGQTGFLALLDAAKGELAPAAGVVILGLRYGDGGLSVDLELSGLQALDRLKRALEEDGLRVAIEGVDKTGDGVRVGMRLEGGRA